jgi:hypothetical protein
MARNDAKDTKTAQAAVGALSRLSFCFVPFVLQTSSASLRFG